MAARVIDNFLPDAAFSAIQDLVMGLGFPWYYTPTITTRDVTDGHRFYMSHIFYGDNFISSVARLITPLVNKVGPVDLIRVKANLYPNQGDLFQHEPHFDYDFPHQAAVFRINTNDGATVFADGERVDSRANRIVFFDGSELHSSTTCTTEAARVNINLNYTGEK